MHAESQLELMLTQDEKQRQRLAFGLVCACLIAVLALFAPTFLSMMNIWYRSETFAHGWVVLPAFLYFAWQSRSELANIPVRPFLPAIAMAAIAGFVWLLGELANALTPSFFSMIALVPLVISAVLGWRWTRALAFPLAFLFFAVPFGEVFVPTLMEWTADFTVAALQVTGVPVYREGQHIVIPSGNWQVVEACSGIRYLIASMSVGMLFAWIMYRSPLRRALFFGASIVVPIVANWMRAYLIILLGHLSENRIASGVDHLIYGWIFFGIVMMVMFAVGAIWREDQTPARSGRGGEVAMPAGTGIGGNRQRAGMVAAVMVVVLGAWPVAQSVLMASRIGSPLTRAVIEPTGGWTAVGAPMSEWRPRLEGASGEHVFTFEKDGHRVGVFLGIFRNQKQGAELVNSMNQSVRTSDADWRVAASGTRRVLVDDQAVDVRSEQIRGIGRNLVVWQWYWLGGESTGSDVRAKLDLAFDRLLGRDDTSAWVSIYTDYSENAAAADRTLASFASEMGGALEVAMRGAAGR